MAGVGLSKAKETQGFRAVALQPRPLVMRKLRFQTELCIASHSPMRCRLELLILLIVSAGCNDDAQPELQPVAENKRFKIIVTSEPLLQMTQSIVKDAADVRQIIPDTTTSRDWKPSSSETASMQQADLILVGGAGYEPWKDRVSLPGSRVRDTAAGYYNQLIRIPDAVTHQHGPDGQHSHPGTVWATWLDPELCMAQLHQVSIHCCRLMPDRRQAFETAEAKLSAELNHLNSELALIQAHILEKSGKTELTVFSDAPHYQYLAQRLGWKLQYLHWLETDTLSDEDRTSLLDAFQQKVENRPAFFLMNSRRSVADADFVRESGGTVIRIDLCELPDSKGTSFPARLEQNLRRIRDAF